MITDEMIIDACNSEPTMALASKKVGLPFSSFKRKARNLGVYKPNQGGKGLLGEKPIQYIPLKEILNGKHPQYQSNKLRLRLLDEGYKEYKCEKCGLTEWNGLPIPLQVNHIDGNSHNHRLNNLEIICPNCHTQTDTYCGKNIRKKEKG